MPLYQYKAYSDTGKISQGSLEAATEGAALERLHEMGLLAFSTEEVCGRSQPKWWQREVELFGSASKGLLAGFTRELAALQGAELPLDQSLRLLAADQGSKASRVLAQPILDKVLAGASLSEALSGHPEAFPEYYLSTVRAGEAAGSVAPVLQELAGYLERLVETRARITSALVYPTILLVTAIAALAVIMTLFIPQILPLFESAGSRSPLFVTMIVTTRDVMVTHWLLVVAALCGCVVLSVAAFTNANCKTLIDRLTLTTPFVGPLVSKSEAARFSRTLSMQLRNGVSLVPALVIVQQVAKNRMIVQALQRVTHAMREGASLHEQLRKEQVFPDLAVRLIAVGEESGKLEDMLAHAAVILEADVLRRIDRFMSLLTPALTLLIGVAVGGLMLAMMDAILSVNEIAF